MLSLLTSPEALNLIFGVVGAVGGYILRQRMQDPKEYILGSLLGRLRAEKEEGSLLDELLELAKTLKEKK